MLKRLKRNLRFQLFILGWVTIAEGIAQVVSLGGCGKIGWRAYFLFDVFEDWEDDA